MSWGILFSNPSTAKTETHNISFHFLLKVGFFFCPHLHRGLRPFESPGFMPKSVSQILISYLDPVRAQPYALKLFDYHYQQMSPSTDEASVLTFCPTFQLTYILSFGLLSAKLLVTTIKTCLLAQLLHLIFCVIRLFSLSTLASNSLFVFGPMRLHLKS